MTTLKTTATHHEVIEILKEKTKATNLEEIRPNVKIVDSNEIEIFFSVSFSLKQGELEKLSTLHEFKLNLPDTTRRMSENHPDFDLNWINDSNLIAFFEAHYVRIYNYLGVNTNYDLIVDTMSKYRGMSSSKRYNL